MKSSTGTLGGGGLYLILLKILREVRPDWTRWMESNAVKENSEGS
jgi:hypothetical protein